MNIADSIKNVLIIDNKEDEVVGLEEVLKTEGTYFTFYTPEKLHESENTIKNHQIIFMDFSLDDTKINPKDNISLIRMALKKICKENFGSYGLVLWTRHMEHIKELKTKLSIDAEKKEYITPLFVVGLNKTDYLKDGYNNLWGDLNKELLENKAASFFFNWRNSVEIASDKALNNMYQLVPEYEQQSEQFPYLLYQMAESYSGIPTKDMQVYDGMYKDAYRAFDELLYSDLINQQKNLDNIFPKQIEKPKYTTIDEELKQTAKINSKLLLDFSANDQSIIMPGNVYQVITDNDLLKLNFNNLKEDKKSTVENLIKNQIQIAVELTPPCDFSNKKVSSRLIGGFMIDCPKTKSDISLFKADSKYLIWPIDYDDSIKFMCFDFRNIYIESDEAMKKASSYKLLFMVKHRLFADILQKFSSHAARLGLSIVQPSLK